MRQRPAVLIIARSARMLVEAARGAWAPWAIDLFGDDDLRAQAHVSYQLDGGSDLNFNASLLVTVEAVLARGGAMPVVLGSGFEHDPALVAALAERVTLAAAPAAVLARLLDKPRLARALAASGVLMPATVSARPQRTAGWLSKASGSCGGAHVRRAGDAADAAGRYYQRYVSGTSISGLYLATAGGCELVALNRHLRWRAGDDFTYQGALTWHSAPGTLCEAVAHAGTQVARELGLRGLFGLDFIRTGAQLMLVDINPRPPATLDLLPDRDVLFSAHVAACSGEPLLYSRPAREQVCGHAVLFALAEWRVPARFEWPAVCCDRPAAGVVVARGAPLCSLRMQAADAATLRERLSAAIAALAARTRGTNGCVAGATTITMMGESSDDGTETG